MNNILRGLLRFIIKLVIGLGLFSAASYLIAYFLHFEPTDTFTTIGIILILCGLFSIVGNMNMTSDAKYFQAMSVSEQSFGKKVRQEFKSRDKSLGFLFYMAVLGGILIGIGYLIK